jgi:hypothetical protein
MGRILKFIEEPTIKDVPNNPKQKYALTDNGREKLQTIS